MMDTNQQIVGIEALSYYLGRISAFLETNKVTLVLPNISTELRDVFVKIVQEDVGFLQDDEYCASVKMKVLNLTDSIKSLKDFGLTYEFKDGKYGPNVLTLKKIKANTCKSLKPLRKPSEMETSTSKEIQPELRLTPLFKTWCLNTATQFVKDDSQLVLRFPQITSVQADFVTNMVSQGIGGEEQMDVGYGFRSIYSPLWKAMRLYGHKYHYKVSYDNDCHVPNMKRVVFTKETISKQKDSKTKETKRTDTEHNTVNIAPTPAPITKAPIRNTAQEVPKKEKTKQIVPKVPKVMVQVKTFIDEGKLTEQFIQESLKRISGFMFADDEASIIFIKMQFAQYYFLRHVEMLSKMDNAYMFFNRESQKHLANVKHNIVNRRVLYKVEEMKGNPKALLKDIQLSKQAVFVDKPVTVRVNEKTTIAKENQEAAAKAATQGVVTLPKKVKDQESKPLKAKEDATITKKNDQERKILKAKGKVKRGRSLSVGRSRAKTAVAEAAQKLREPFGKIVKEKLLEGLAQPVQSDKAMKMMQSMGWKGGALGLRGDGITVPIMPALDSLNRAGLGHERTKPNPKESNPKNPKPKDKPKAQNPSSKTGQLLKIRVGLKDSSLSPNGIKPPGVIQLSLNPELHKTIHLNVDCRVYILDALYKLITTDVITVKLDFSYVPGIKKPLRTYNFLSSACQLFNKRKPIMLALNLEKMLVAKINSAMKNRPDIMIGEELDMESKSCLVYKFSKSDPCHQIPCIDLKKNQPFELTKPAKIYPVKQTKPKIDSVQQTKPAKIDPVLQTKPAKIDPIQQTKPAKIGSVKQTNTANINSVKTNTGSIDTVKYTNIEEAYTIKHTKTKNIGTSENIETVKTGIDITYAKDCKITDSNVEEKGLKYLVPDKDNIPTQTNSIETKSTIKIIEPKEIIESKPIVTEKTDTNEVITLINNNNSSNDMTKTQSDGKIECTVQFESVIDQSNNNTGSDNIKNTDNNEINDNCDNFDRHNVDSTNICTNSQDMTNVNENKTDSVVRDMDNDQTNESCDNFDRHNINSTNICTNEQDMADITENDTESGVRDVDNNQTNENCDNFDRHNINSTNICTNEQDMADITENDTESGVRDVDNNQTNENCDNFDRHNINSTNICTNEQDMADITENDTESDVRDVDNNQTNKNCDNFDRNNIDSTNICTIDQNMANTNENDTESDVRYMDNKDKLELDLFDYEFSDDFDFTVTNIDVDSDDEDRLLNPVEGSADEINNNIDKSPLDFFKIDDLENATVNDSFDIDKSQRDESDSGISQNSHERRRLVYTREDETIKKHKLTRDYKKLFIIHKDPEMRIVKEKAQEIQQQIINTIDYTRDNLPMLTCEGIQNGGLLYCCHDENSVLFLEKIINSYFSDLHINYRFDSKPLTRTMAFRINTFVEEKSSNVLNRIELHNIGLDALKWEIIKKEQYGEFVVIYIKIDEDSFNYILDCNFVLCAGNDCAKFTIIWD